jgi:hypothetical protein
MKRDIDGIYRGIDVPVKRGILQNRFALDGFGV